jgi:hypothetical protein
LPTESKLLFIENKNQWDESVRYKAKLTPGFIDFKKNQFHFVFFNEDIHEMMHDRKNSSVKNTISGHVFNINFIDANPNVEFSSDKNQAYYHNYFLGNDESKWAGNVSLFENITYHELYNGIDMLIKSENQNMVYDYIVKPHADITQIKVQYE